MSISSIDELRDAVRRKASVGTAIQRQPDDDPRRSWLGRVSVLGAGEVLYLGLGSVDGEPVWAATTQYP